MIVLKLRAARARQKAKEGRCEGAKPSGYYDGQDAVLKRMEALRREGMGFDRIAAAVECRRSEASPGAKVAWSDRESVPHGKVEERLNWRLRH
jgi:hypothetical protein